MADYLIGVAQAVPAVLLTLAAVWGMFRLENLLEARGVVRVLRLLAVSVTGIVAVALITLLVYGSCPKGPEVVPAITLVPYVVLTFGCLKSDLFQLTPGKPSWLSRIPIKISLPVVSVAFILILGFYHDSAAGWERSIVKFCAYAVTVVCNYYFCYIAISHLFTLKYGFRHWILMLLEAAIFVALVYAFVYYAHPEFDNWADLYSDI